MTLDLRLDEVLAHPVDAVWRALTDPRRLARWLMDNDFEPRVGHKFTLTDAPIADRPCLVECEVLELEPPRRMVWSWSSGMDGEVETRVTFELHPEGGGTRLVVRHEGPAIPGQRDDVTAGWTRKLAILGRVLGPEYSRRVAFAAHRPAVFDAITTLDALRGWWTTIVSGSTTPSGELRFEFAGLDEHIVMHVDRATRPSSVQWSCRTHTSQPDWKGTTVTFDLTARASEACEMSFQHAGIAAASVEAGWDRFLSSLVAFVDRGHGAPFGA